MHCEEVMTRSVEWISPEESVENAAKLMAFHNVGMLPVCDPEGNALGVLTDRDIALRVAGANLRARETAVADVMSREPAFVTPTTPVERAEQLMAEVSVQRLLVLGDGNRLCGVLSIADVVSRTGGRQALEAARNVMARETPDRRTGEPHPARPVTPEYFHGKPGDDVDEDLEPVRSTQADIVIRGGSTGMKEFGG